MLRLLTPTDCVKDRLAWYYHTGDTECLEQAYLVARQHAINLNEIDRWSSGEDNSEEFKGLIDSLIATQASDFFSPVGLSCCPVSLLEFRRHSRTVT